MPFEVYIFIQCTKKYISTNLWLVDFPVIQVDVMHHLPTEQVNNFCFLSNYVMLLRKAFKLACNGSNLSKGRAGNSSLFVPCLLLPKQERGTSKREKLNSNLASRYTHLVFGVIQSFKKHEGLRNGDFTLDFTSLQVHDL